MSQPLCQGLWAAEGEPGSAGDVREGPAGAAPTAGLCVSGAVYGAPSRVPGCCGAGGDVRCLALRDVGLRSLLLPLCPASTLQCAESLHQAHGCTGFPYRLGQGCH